MVIGDAIKSIGGISAIWQIAFDGYKNIGNKLDVDVTFSCSGFSVGSE